METKIESSTMPDETRLSNDSVCEMLSIRTNSLLSEICQSKTFQLSKKDQLPEDPCSCSSNSTRENKVDLIVLIDTSSSMEPAASEISHAADQAIEKAKKLCNPDLRVVWLGVDYTKPGSATMPGGTWSNFTQTHEEYLQAIGYMGPFVHNNPDSGYPPEQGADAISDLSNHFDWRAKACRAIFYVSDTNLDGLFHSADDDNATANAIIQAQSNDVKIFAHFADPPQGTNNLPATQQNYHDLCNETGGRAAIGGNPSEALYVELLTEAICQACGGCKSVEIPKVNPCISISWGDGENDCLETDDYEVMCLTVCNCFSNVTFKNVTIPFLEVLTVDGNPVPVLPDGTPSVQLVPIGPICFGDIGPCEENKATCVSRQFVLRTCGAKEGSYVIRLKAVCFEICYHFLSQETFHFDLVKS